MAKEEGMVVMFMFVMIGGPALIPCEMNDFDEVFHASRRGPLLLYIDVGA
jgi:hypothetical protein